MYIYERLCSDRLMDQPTAKTTNRRNLKFGRSVVRMIWVNNKKIFFGVCDSLFDQINH